ncbi:MAG: hypothetical protein KTR31_25490 [Myxococcales bacterium]|nr:hypothetical protein [Myxococcales bacterium]
MSIPRPRTVDDLEPVTTALNEAAHADRLAWVRSLNAADQKHLFALAEGHAMRSVDLADSEGMVRFPGRNGLLLFSFFAKCFAQLGEEGVGYNDNDFGWLNFAAKRVTGPGHFTFYDSPEVPGEVWIDYRRLPQNRHPEFPPMRSNERGLPSLVYGNMVDILRKVSDHVYIGDSFKNLPRPASAGRPPLLVRIGSLLPTAPFVLCRES